MIVAMPAAAVASRGSLLGLALAQVMRSAVAGVLWVAMVAEAFPASVRSSGFALTAGIATALIGGTAPWIAQIIVTMTAAEAAPGVYVAVIGSLALVALWRWPETDSRISTERSATPESGSFENCRPFPDRSVPEHQGMFARSDRGCSSTCGATDLGL